MNVYPRLTTSSAIAVLVTFVLTMMATGQAATCPAGELRGPCIECPVEFVSTTEAAESPPLYWEVCGFELGRREVIYFLPQSIAVVRQAGQPLQNLRRRPSGDLLLVATLDFHPWGRSDDLGHSRLVESIKTRYPGVRWRPVKPIGADIPMISIGKWQDWTKSIKISPLSGLDYFDDLRLEIVFAREFAAPAEAALRRSLAVMGKVVYRYRGYLANGQSREMEHPIAIHVGELVID